MTEKRRIFWNIVATYGRSLYGIVLGLFCGRWALMALGEVDYGLIGLVGGLTVFIAFFNNVLAGANARFYSVSIGAAATAQDKSAALEDCRQWFNTAFSVHIVVPVFLMVVGYPLGEYAIKNWLTIPIERIAACIWVWRYVCLSCFVGMLNVPFTAMYSAKQYIAELTIYSFVTSTLNVVFLYYMVSHPGDWLSTYAGWTCALSVIPQFIICIRACKIFPECRFNLSYMMSLSRVKMLGVFSGWQFLGILCDLFKNNCMTIVVNKFFGVRMNAAHTIGTNLQGQCNTLASAMQGAFVPVITQAYGAGDFEKMRTMAYRVCKYNVAFFALFAIPLAIEIDEILLLWLKNPPAFTAGLCICAIAYHIVDCCTVGHMVVVNATGRIAGYHIVLCLVNILTLPMAITVGLIWHDVYLIMWVVIAMQGINSIGRLVFAQALGGMLISRWGREVFLPCLCAIMVGALPGLVIQKFQNPSFVRICVVTLCFEMLFTTVFYFYVLSVDERVFIVSKIKSRLEKIGGMK